MAAKRKCLCCNEKYSYCPNCNGPDRLKPTWYSSFCSETCKTLWETLSKYSMGFVDKKDAMATIKALPLKDNSNYVECVQRDMAKVLVEEPKPKRIKKTEIKLPEIATEIAIPQEIQPKVEINPVKEIAFKAVKIPVVEKTEESHEVVNKTEENE